MTNGAHDYEARCRELQASCAFFWFLWAAFMASLFFSFMSHKSGGGGSARGPVRKGPVMTQV